MHKVNINMAAKIVVFIYSILFLTVGTVSGQNDTIRVGINEFIETAMRESSMLKTQRSQVELSRNRVDQARAQRFLPRIELSTAHGLVPAVKSDVPGLPPGQYYLDPNLRNDWYDWGLFTRVEISSLQPLYTWGAIGNAINAARAGVIATQAAYEVESTNFELQLYELYYTRLLTMELKRLASDALKQLEEAELKIEELIEEGDTSLEESDLFQFRIFKYEFLYRIDEIDETVRFVEAAWNLALNNQSQTIYQPLEVFLDPVPFELNDVIYFEEMAKINRPEITQINAVLSAARYGLEVSKAANYPSLFMALSAAYANTPNRPKQDNPFIINNTNYESIRYGIGIRQNLNFGVNRTSINRSELQVRQARYAREAANDGIRLDVRDKYRSMMMSYSRLNNTREALQVSNEWLRMEQIDYDLGFGEVKKLVDAVKANLELEVSYRQRIYDFNVNVGKLYKASGIPITN
jgi:outer membrane protein TolC